MIIKRPGVYFTNILRAAFTIADPESALLESLRLKATRTMSLKLTPGILFHQHFMSSLFTKKCFVL